MKQTINFCQFTDAFRNAGRKDQFSYSALNTLFDYLEQYEDDCCEEIELDVIALCCEYSEYENIEEFQADYGEEFKTIEDIENRTQVIIIDDESFIIQQF